MRWLAVAIVALLFGRPVMAQAPKARDLIGQWRRQSDTTLKITFRADSTFTFSGLAETEFGGKARPIDLVGRWILMKDTLTYIQPNLQIGKVGLAQGHSPALDALSNDTLRLLTLRGRVLTMKTRDGNDYLYERIGAMEASPVAKSERNNPLIEHP